MPHTVLFTRELTSKQAEYAKALGLELIPFPLIRTSLLSNSGELTAALVTNQTAVVAFTSQKAVQFVKTHTNLIELLKTRQLFTVGNKTADALAELDLHAAYPAVQTASELALVLSTHKDKLPLVIHPCGNRRRADLEKGLQRYGLGYQDITVYTSEEINPSEDLPADLSAIVFASPSAVQAFFKQGYGERTQAPCFAIGPTTAAAVRAYGRPCKMPPRPGFDTLLQLVAVEVV